MCEMCDLQEVSQECPELCTCHIMGLEPRMWVKVACEHANLTKLPDRLPKNTEVLNVSGNQIQSLTPVRDNHDYSNLRALRADQNQIKNMGDLIGSQFVKNRPNMLNLQLNQLTNVCPSF